MFPPKALLARLDRRLPMLGAGARNLPERQQTLRDAIAWSYDLLDAEEQTLFRRLAVFAGGCTVEAVETVCGAGTDGSEQRRDILEILASLVDNSLLVARSDAPSSRGKEDEGARFSMLETIREYAAERLETSGEAEALHRAQAFYYLTLAEDAQPEAFLYTPGEWFALLEEEHDNLRAALRWAIRIREAGVGTRLALVMWRFWAARYLSEGRRWMEAVLALGAEEGRAGGAEAGLPARRWAYLHLATGILASVQGDYDRTEALCEESLALYTEIGHRRGTSGPLRELGEVAYRRGDYERAVRLSEQALAVARESGSAFGAGLAISNLAGALRAQGDLERARSLLEESLTSLRRQGLPLRVAYALAVTLARLASIECEMGREARASELYKESLELERQYWFGFEAFACMEGLARVAAVQGRPERAARLLGASAALREELGTPLSPIVQADHDHALNAARAALGEEAFEAAWTKGSEMTFEEAIAYALSDDG